MWSATLEKRVAPSDEEEAVTSMNAASVTCHPHMKESEALSHTYSIGKILKCKSQNYKILRGKPMGTFMPFDSSLI